jgi:hypothetical protein
MTDRDRPKMSDDEYAVDKNSISPLSPPRGAEEGRKEKAGSERGPSDTSSFGAKRDPAQNRAGEGRVKERSPRKPRGGVTSPAGIEAILSFQARKEGLDYSGWGVERKRQKLASIAERWDFASEADPPMKLRRQISPNAESCDYILKRLRKITSQAVLKAEVDALNAKKHDHVSHDSTPDAPARATQDLSLPSPRAEDSQPAQGNVEAASAEENYIEPFDF